MNKLEEFVKEGEKFVYFVSPQANHPVVASFKDGFLEYLEIGRDMPRSFSENEALYLFGKELRLPYFSVSVDEEGHLHVITSSKMYYVLEAEARSNTF